MWGNVLYTNLFSLLPTFILGLVLGEYGESEWGRAQWTVVSVLMVMGSGVVGTAISYTGWVARDLLSATSYTLVGVIIKIITILFNTLVWEQHASAGGIISLFVCLVGGAFYQQSPLRAELDYSQVAQEEEEVEMLNVELDAEYGVKRRGASMTASPSPIMVGA